MRRVALFAVVAGIGFALGRAAAPGQPPEAMEWSTVADLARPRAYASAVLVDSGEILVVGGLDRSDEHITIATSELFDPVTRRVTVLPQRLLGRLNQQLTVAWGGRVVMTGGTEWLGDSWGTVGLVEVYLPWSRTWLNAAPMLQPRSDHAAVTLRDGRVLVAGGNYNARLLRSAEIYDPASDTWSYAALLPRPRTSFSMATLPDGTVLAVGGFQEDGQMTTSTLIYEPSQDRWIAGPSLREVRLNHTMVALPDGDLLLLGGERTGAGTAERYSWRDRRFDHAGVLAEPRLVAQAAALPDGRVVAVGGLPQDRYRQRFSPLAQAELWDPGKEAWRVLPAAPTKRAYAQLIATDRAVYRLSGIGDDEAPFTSIEELTWH